MTFNFKACSKYAIEQSCTECWSLAMVNNAGKPNSLPARLGNSTMPSFTSDANMCAVWKSTRRRPVLHSIPCSTDRNQSNEDKRGIVICSFRRRFLVSVEVSTRGLLKKFVIWRFHPDNSPSVKETPSEPSFVRLSRRTWAPPGREFPKTTGGKWLFPRLENRN